MGSDLAVTLQLFPVESRPALLPWRTPVNCRDAADPGTCEALDSVMTEVDTAGKPLARASASTESSVVDYQSLNSEWCGTSHAALRKQVVNETSSRTLLAHSECVHYPRDAVESKVTETIIDFEKCAMVLRGEELRQFP